jgi:hypothetical protein
MNEVESKINEHVAMIESDIKKIEAENEEEKNKQILKILSKIKLYKQI